MKSDFICELSNVHLSFRAPAHRAWSLRDQFIDIMKSPLKSMVAAQDKARVLKGITLKIKAGDRLAVLGRNGAGKTTLARCLAGVYKPELGHMSVNGRVRAIFDPAVGVFPELTGRENIRILIHYLYPERKHEFAVMEKEIAEFSGLGEHLDLRFRTYSKGMQTRLGLAVVTARTSDLVILDEVFDGADRFFREKMSERLDTFLKTSKSVMFISHSPEQIRQVCNRAVVIEDGIIAFDGGVEEAISYYHSLRSYEHQPVL